jgi:GR25 family glycosyltransferase involved in LPS biosynthesis
MSKLTAAAADPCDGPVWHACPPDPACVHCNGSLEHAAAPFDWSFIDAAYCISMKTRADRAASAAAQFHKVGLCRHVLFYRPVRHPKKGVIGSWESHRAVAMEGLRRGFERVLVFEDDVQFARRVRPETVRSVGRALNGLPSDWTIFFLGHWPLKAYFVRRNVLRTSSGCAHAYIANRRLLEWLEAHPWGSPGVAKHRLVGRAIDSAYAKLQGTYAYFPMIATQSASPSDNFTAQQKVRKKNKRRLRHIVTHSRHREWLLAHLMRPAEFAVAALSPVFLLTDLAKRTRSPREEQGSAGV